MRASRAYDIFFDHDAADVVAAKTQPQLAGLQPWRNPRRLDVQYVFEVKAGERQHLQVLDCGRVFLHEISQRSIFALEGPGNEGGEAAGVLLNLADQVKMIHT